jgi:hypothetical protein
MACEIFGKRHVRIRFQLLSFILASGITVSFAGDTAKLTPDASVPAELVLRMSRTSPVIIAGERVQVEWQLENAGQKSVYVCQWPGIAFSHHWECPNGLLKGAGPGYPSFRRLDRKYYLELKPGEALVGYGEVNVSPTPSGVLSIRAEFRCDQTGLEYGLSAWKGRISSDWLSIEVPKDEKAEACEP